MTQFDQQVALVTGAGQGVGQGIAFALAEAGASVVLLGRTQSKLDATAQEIENRGGRALPLACDIKDPSSMASCVSQTVEQFGGLNILVNNAQEVPLGTLGDIDEDKFQAGWESGPLAVFRMMRLCRPHLANGGRIVNLASSAARRWDVAGYGLYATVKEAVRQLTRTAACEWGAEGIRANCILPLAKSPGMEWWMQEYPEQVAAFAETVPLGYIGDCEADIGRFVVDLCGEGCRYINGQSIAVDGGQVNLG